MVEKKDKTRQIYLDHAATTPMRSKVLEAMRPYFCELYGNPSSIHVPGHEARKAVESSRQKVAQLLGCKHEEVLFTAGGSEADNMAIKGLALEKGSGHIITSTIEHHAVLESCEFLQGLGFEVDYLPVDSGGLLDPDAVKQAIRKDTILVTVMHANNEVGTIQPVDEIAAIAKEREVPFHTDAVQTVGHLPIDLNCLRADMLSLSAHKFYGPKGVGVLIKRRELRIKPWLTGGGQELGLRAGTHNVPGIVGLATALELAVKELSEQGKRLSGERDYLIEQITSRVADVQLNGHPEKRLPNNANFSVSYIEGESLLLELSFRGIAASTGSACSSESLDPSHVLLALGITKEDAHGSLRLSLGRGTCRADIDYAVGAIEESVEKLRGMSPLYQELKGKK